MFCSSCGNTIKENFKFCVRCGSPAHSTANVAKSNLGSSNGGAVSRNESQRSVLSLNDFMDKKKEERKSNFKTNKKGKQARSKDEVVTINIGLMRISEDGGLKPVRGKNLPLKTRTSANSEDILNAGVVKHAMHNSSDVIIASAERFKLLYPDGTLVDNLKESDKPFTLEKYKCEIGKPYNRLTFYVCSNSDYYDRIVKGLLNTDIESSDDDEKEPLEVFSKKACLDVCAPKSVSTNSSNSNPTSIQGTRDKCAIEESEPQEKLEVGSQFATQTSSTTTPYSIVKDIFPHLSDLAILNALKECGDVENAVNKLSEKTFGSDQIDCYASLIGDNDDWDSDELMESVWTCKANTPKEVEQGLDDQLKELSKKCQDSNNEIKLKVRRSCVWEDTLLKLKRCPKETLSNGMVRVQFIGEPAVDEGGPRKELFFLIHRHMQLSCLFTDEPHRRIFAHNVMALQREEYYSYGVLSALSILQGSPGPTMFSSPVVDYILHGKLEAVLTSVSDLPNEKVRLKLEELDLISDPEVFKREASFNVQFRFKAGYSKPLVTLEDKQEFFRCICLHYMILSTLPEIEQFIQGLNINGVLDTMRKNPLSSRKLLQSSGVKELSADKVDEMFHFCYSPIGSNKRKDEEAIAFNFRQYLEDVEKELVSTSILDPDTGDLNTVTVQLSHILQFITGCPGIPATGFDSQLSVNFEHTETQRKLTANTCSCTLHLPVGKVLIEYEKFKNEFTECMFNSPGFGQV